MEVSPPTLIVTETAPGVVLLTGKTEATVVPVATTPAAVVAVQSTYAVVLLSSSGPQGAEGPAGASSVPAAKLVALAALTEPLSGLSYAADGVILSAGDRVLLTQQTNAAHNGLWVAQAGVWGRPSDFASGSTFTSLIVAVLKGEECEGSLWNLVSAPATVDTTAQTWKQAGVLASQIEEIEPGGTDGQFMEKHGAKARWGTPSTGESITGTKAVGDVAYIPGPGTTPVWTKLKQLVTKRLVTEEPPVITGEHTPATNTVLYCEPTTLQPQVVIKLPPQEGEVVEQGDLIEVLFNTTAVVGGSVLIKQPSAAEGPAEKEYELTRVGDSILFWFEGGLGKQWVPIGWFSNVRGVVAPLKLTPTKTGDVIDVKLPVTYTGTLQKWEDNTGNVFFQMSSNGAITFSFGVNHENFLTTKYKTDEKPRFELETDGKHHWGLGEKNATDTTLERGTRASSLKTNGAIGVTGLGHGQEEGHFIGVAQLGGEEPKPNTVAGLIYKKGDFLLDIDTATTWECWTAGVAGGASSNEETGTRAKWRHWIPKDANASASGYVAQTFPFAAVAATSEFQPTSGTLYLAKVMLPSGATSVKNLWLGLATVGSGLTIARCLLLNAAGTVVAKSGDMSTLWGEKPGKLSKMPTEGSPPTIEGLPAEGSTPQRPWGWLGILCVGTTTPKFYASPNKTIEFLNGADSGSTNKEEMRVGINGTGRTEVPSSITLSSNSNTGAGELFFGAFN